VFAEHDGDVSNCRHVSAYTTDDVFLPIQIALSSGIELSVVGDVVITFCEQFWGGPGEISAVGVSAWVH
jgi:hypothetical protein